MQVNRHVVLPSAMTWIIASLHVAFGFAIIGAVVGELLGSTAGLGLVIQTSMNTFNPDGVFAGMVHHRGDRTDRRGPDRGIGEARARVAPAVAGLPAAAVAAHAANHTHHDNQLSQGRRQQ